MNTALVIFVKTLGLSPVKTRLAKDIGIENAEAFYKRSVNATSALAHKIKLDLADIDIYWAIAEEEGVENEVWSNFNKIFQGNGSFGDRLSSVYEELIQKYSSVCFMGADSPHFGHIEFIKKTFDIDKIEDLKNYKKNDFCINDFLPEQCDLIKWVGDNF